MAILLYILVVIGTLIVIASGFWVAITLAKVVTTKKIIPKQKSEH